MIIEIDLERPMWRVCECGARVLEPRGGSGTMPDWWWEHVASDQSCAHVVALVRVPEFRFRLRWHGETTKLSYALPI